MVQEGPVMMLFRDEEVSVVFGESAEVQLPQAVVQHSKLLLEMQV